MDRVATSRNCWLFSRVLGCFLVLSGGCFFLSTPAFANTYCVDDTSDPGAGVAGDCAATCDGSNDCALRDAVAAANANNGADTITFAFGAQTHNIAAALNLTDATGGTTINGGAAGPTVSHDVVINGTGTGGILCLVINNSANNVIKGLTIQDCNSAIYISGASATGNKVQNNYVGTNSAGTAAVANGFGVRIRTSATGNTVGTDGDGAGDAAEGNVISGGTAAGVYIDSGTNTVAGNIIGLNAAGNAAIPNSTYGVHIIGSTSNNIVGTNGNGTSDTLERNIISGNSNTGVSIEAPTPTGNRVAGNYIGANSAGTSAIANGGSGVGCGTSGNYIGTNGDGSAGEASEGNLISGNTAYGITLNGSSYVSGNTIGLDAGGTSAIANGSGGIYASGASNIIGTNGDGTSDNLERNVISGNTNYGVLIGTGSATGNRVAGNYIGTNSAGTGAVGNAGPGVNIYNSAASNIVGTNGDGNGDIAERNVISGNTSDGVYIVTDSNTVAGNYIGTAADGVSDLGNGRHGVFLDTTSANNTIGGDLAAEANTIAYNGDVSTEYGVRIVGAGSDGNDILRNSFFNNHDIGIKLNGAGANNDQAAPSITSRTITGGNIVLNGTSTASAAVQIFEADSDNQEGKNYVGQAAADGSGNWTFTLSSPYDENGKKFVATATDGTNGTSQFSSSYTLGNNAPVASAQTAATNEDTNVTITLGLTDADGGDTTTASIVTLPTGGTLYQTADGTTLGAAITPVPATVTDSSKRVIYVPSANANGNGVGNFTFRGSDGLNTSNTATVTVNITAVNDTPTANAQAVTVNENAPTGIILSGADADGNPLTYIVFTSPRHGSLSGLNASTGGVIYTPTGAYKGGDSFSFWVTDGTAYSNSAAVTITVVHVNYPPAASARTAGTSQNTAVTITLSASDSNGDTLTYSIASNPGHGTLSGLSASAGTVTYTPATDYYGSDSFTYRAGDGSADSSPATVTITISQTANRAPTVSAGADLTAVEGATVRLIGNATDADGDTLTYQWSQSSGTTVSLTNADKAQSSFTAPAPDGSGDLEFVLSVSDGTDTATDSVRVKVSRRNFTMDDAVKLTGRVVAASEGMAITSEEGVRYDGREATEVDLGHGSLLYSTDSTPVEILVLDDRIIVADPACRNNAGAVVMVDTAVLKKNSTIDLNDSSFTDKAGVTASFGSQEGDLYGYVIKSADVDGDGLEEIISAAPGTSNGTVYVLSGSDLETRNMILGSAAEPFKTPLLLTADVNNADGTDLLIGLPEGAAPSVAALKSADVDITASVFDGILGTSDLPALIDLASDEADFVLTANGSVSLASGGDLDGDGNEDTVFSASDGFGVDVIFGSGGVGADLISLDVDGSFVSAVTDPADSLAAGDVTGDGYADVVMGFASASDGRGEIIVVPGRDNWDESAYNLDNAVVVTGLDGDGIGEWLILEDYDGDGVVDIYTNDGPDGSYLITLGKLIDEASGGGTGNEADGEGGSRLGPGGFGGCSMDVHNSPQGGVMILFVGLLGGLSLFLLPLWKRGIKGDFLIMSPSTSKSPLTPLFQRGGKEIVLLSLLLSFSSCGGSSGSGTPTDEGGSGGTAPGEEWTYLTLTGMITAPTVEEADGSLSAGRALRRIVDEASDGVTCEIHDLDGNYLSSVTTDADGSFDKTVAIADADEGSPLRLIISCENGIHNFAEAEAAGSTVDVDTGIADVDTTLAAITMTGWDGENSATTSGEDLECLFNLNKSLWEEATEGEGELADNNARFREIVEGFMAGGGEPEEAGYADWAPLLHDVVSGEASREEVLEPMAERAAGVVDDLDAAEFVESYEEAAEGFRTVAGTLNDQIDLLHEEAVSSGDTTVDDVCASIEAGAIEPGAIVGPMLAGDLDEFVMAFDNADGFFLHFNLLKECREAGSCGEMAGKPSAFLGFMLGFGGDYSGAFDSSGRPDSDTMEGAFFIAQNCNENTAGAIKTCGEGLQERVWVNGWSAFRDSSGAFDPIFFVWRGGEPAVEDTEKMFGPFANWLNLKTGYGAVGNGVADDTTAIQEALDDLGKEGVGLTLYIPAGTYRITSGLVVTGSTGVQTGKGISIIGEDPDTTILKWDGAVGGVLFGTKGMTYARIQRLTFDGNSKAQTAIRLVMDGTGYYEMANWFSDLVIKDSGYGIRAGVYGTRGTSEVMMLRCRFLRNTIAGYQSNDWNTLNMWINDSYFEDNYVGVTNAGPVTASGGAASGYEAAWQGSGVGTFEVSSSLFKGSTAADILVHPSDRFGIRRNTSVGSNAFFIALHNGQNGDIASLQDNVILDAVSSNAIRLETLGPVLLLDNKVRSLAANSGPVVTSARPIDLTSVGNTYTVANPYSLSYVGSDSVRHIEIDTAVAGRSSLNPSIPAIPNTPEWHTGPVIEVAVGAITADIQSAINAAVDEEELEPVVHLPRGDYNIAQTLIVPAGSRIRLVGDGFIAENPRTGTRLKWAGTGAGPVLKLLGPSRAAIQDLMVDGNSIAEGILVDNADQSGGRIFGEMVLAGYNTGAGIFADGLDLTLVELHASISTWQTSGAAIKVVGGPNAALGNPGTGRTNLFMGMLNENPLCLDVSQGGRVLLQDIYSEDDATTDPFMQLTGRGEVTIDGAKIHRGNGAAPNIAISDFDGRVALSGIRFYNKPVEITGNVATQVLALGSQGVSMDDFFVNSSTGAQASLLNSRKHIAGSWGVANEGGAEAAFIRDMLSPMRDEKPMGGTAGVPADATDVHFARVWVKYCVNGFHFKR